MGTSGSEEADDLGDENGATENGSHVGILVLRLRVCGLAFRYCDIHYASLALNRQVLKASDKSSISSGTV